MSSHSSVSSRECRKCKKCRKYKKNEMSDLNQIKNKLSELQLAFSDLEINTISGLGPINTKLSEVNYGVIENLDATKINYSLSSQWYSQYSNIITILGNLNSICPNKLDLVNSFKITETKIDSLDKKLDLIYSQVTKSKVGTVVGTLQGSFAIA